MINQRGFAPIFILMFGLAVLGGVGGGGYYLYSQQKLRSVTDFESCAKLYPVMTSYPGQCNTPDGRHFVQLLSEEEQRKLIPPSDQPSDADKVATVSPLPSASVTTIQPVIATPVSIEDATIPVKTLPLATYTVTVMNTSKWKRMDYDFSSYLYSPNWRVHSMVGLLGNESSPFEMFDVTTGSFPTSVALSGIMGYQTADEYVPYYPEEYTHIDYKVKNLTVHSFQGFTSSEEYKNGLPVYSYHFVFDRKYPLDFVIDREGEAPLQQTIDEMLTLISTYKEKELH